jgi:excisionase family DNA binding protein
MTKSSIKSAPEQLAFDFDLPPQPSVKPERLLTTGEACALFNLKPHVLRRAIKRGAIPRYSIGNTRIRVRASDIEHVIEASRTGGK